MDFKFRPGELVTLDPSWTYSWAELYVHYSEKCVEFRYGNIGLVISTYFSEERKENFVELLIGQDLCYCNEDLLVKAKK